MLACKAASLASPFGTHHFFFEDDDEEEEGASDGVNAVGPDTGSDVGLGPDAGADVGLSPDLRPDMGLVAGGDAGPDMGLGPDVGPGPDVGTDACIRPWQPCSICIFPNY